MVLRRRRRRVSRLQVRFWVWVTAEWLQQYFPHGYSAFQFPAEVPSWPPLRFGGERTSARADNGSGLGSRPMGGRPVSQDYGLIVLKSSRADRG